MEKTTLTAANEAAAKEDALRKRAARQAAASQETVAAPEMVKVRVLKLGADKISMGTHIAGIGDAYYERGEEFLAERPIAEVLEEKGWVEIEEPEAPVKPAQKGA